MSDPFNPKRSLSLDGLSVFLAMPTHRPLEPQVAGSFMNTKQEFSDRGLPFNAIVKSGNSLVHHARTSAAWDFLKSDCNRLFWVDSDIVWDPKDFIRLVALSTEMDIVAGAYIAKQDPPLFMVNGLIDGLEANEWGCLPLDGLGMGFCCMTRKVIEAIAAQSPKMRFNCYEELVPAMFHYGERIEGAEARGEDMQFLADAKQLGFQLWVDPSITLGHVGPKVYRASLKDYLTNSEAVAA